MQGIETGRSLLPRDRCMARDMPNVGNRDQEVSPTARAQHGEGQALALRVNVARGPVPRDRCPT